MTRKTIDGDALSSSRPAGQKARMVEGDRRLDAQRKLIVELERNGQDASEARTDMQVLEMRQERRRARSRDGAVE